MPPGSRLSSSQVSGLQPGRAPGISTPRRSELPNGLTVATRQRSGSRVLAIDLAVRAGARYETPETASAARFLQQALLLGTARWPSRDQLLRAITSRGGELTVTAGREVIEVRLVVELADLDLGLAVLRDVVTASRFDPDLLGRERGIILQRLADREDDPENRAIDVLFDAVFAGHPLANRPTGTVEGVRALPLDAPRQYWESRVVGPNLIAGVVSGLEHEAVVARMEAAFGDLPVGPAQPSNAAPFPVAPPASATIEAGTNQAHVFVGIPVPGVTAADRAPLRVANAVLARTSGRLYAEIRDRRGLAYSTSSSVAQYADGGIAYAHAGTDPVNVETVRALLVAELLRLRDEPLDPVELDNARRGEVGARILNRETSRDEATNLARDAVYGLPPATEQDAQLLAVTTDDVRRVAREYFDPARMTVVIARPAGGSDDEGEQP